MTFNQFYLVVIPLLISFSISSEENFDSNQDFYRYLDKNNTSSFLVSEKGKIVIDQEFKIRKSLKPKSITFSNLLQHGFVQNRSQEDVASIQKSVVSILIGIAQQKELLDINNLLVLN